MDTIPTLLTQQSGDRRRLLDRVETLIPEITGRAALYDEAAQFPAKDIAALRAAGVLLAPMPTRAGGMGMGTEADGGEALSKLLRLLGSANLSVGRLYEAHVNAIRLISKLGTATQVQQAAYQIQAGALFGLWVTDPADNALRVNEAGILKGGKAFCSGAGHVARAVVTLQDAEGQTRLANLSAEDAIATPLPVQMQGMRAAQTGRVAFEGIPIDPSAYLGAPGAYLAEPDFSAGAWRTCAVTCGGLEALLALAMRQLVTRGRAGDPHQQARMGRAWIAQETALQWLNRARAAAEAPNPETSTRDIVSTVGLARIAIEDACLAVLQSVERSLGLAAFMQPSAIERLRRDLGTYLRQPAADDVLTEAAAHIMQTRHRA